MKRISVSIGCVEKEFNIKLITSKEELEDIVHNHELGTYYDIAYDNNLSKYSGEFKTITDALAEETTINRNKLDIFHNVGIVFCVNEKYYRINCPSTIGLEESCQCSCMNCWKESLEAEWLRSESFNRALKEYNINKEDIVKNVEKKEKLKVLDSFRSGNKVDVIAIKLFKIDSKIYNSCPDIFGLESNEMNGGCKLNPSCSRCKNCWKRGIEDFLEGEE